ncbi:MAG: DUF6916 family protein [Jatrophihabitantaceae bacterium]
MSNAAMSDQPTTPSYQAYADRVDTEFQLRLPDGDHAQLVLIECTASSPTSFALTFKAGPRAPIEQASYWLTADGFGPELVFLVPLRHRPNDSDYPLEYHAIFNF